MQSAAVGKICWRAYPILDRERLDCGTRWQPTMWTQIVGYTSEGDGEQEGSPTQLSRGGVRSVMRSGQLLRQEGVTVGDTDTRCRLCIEDRRADAWHTICCDKNDRAEGARETMLKGLARVWRALDVVKAAEKKPDGRQEKEEERATTKWDWLKEDVRTTHL
eukprot:7387464-Prymnesium_polylepis.1